MDILIPKEQKLEIECRPADQVLAIKNQIFQSRGFFTNFISLSFNNQKLDNDLATLQSYGITNGSIIKLTHWNDPLRFTEKKYFKLATD